MTVVSSGATPWPRWAESVFNRRMERAWPRGDVRLLRRQRARGAVLRRPHVPPCGSSRRASSGKWRAALEEVGARVQRARLFGFTAASSTTRRSSVPRRGRARRPDGRPRARADRLRRMNGRSPRASPSLRRPAPGLLRATAPRDHRPRRWRSGSQQDYDPTSPCSSPPAAGGAVPTEARACSRPGATASRRRSRRATPRSRTRRSLLAAAPEAGRGEGGRGARGDAASTRPARERRLRPPPVRGHAEERGRPSSHLPRRRGAARGPPRTAASPPAAQVAWERPPRARSRAPDPRA